jgi:peptidoglycan/xylan/chitin deacetylase (PgdA/CDA1 family)
MICSSFPESALRFCIVAKRLRSIPAAILAVLLAVAALTGPFACASAEESGRVPILVYHRFGEIVTDSMTVRTATFAAQLEWLTSHHYRIIPLRRLIDLLSDRQAALPPRAVVITADDGHESVYREMLPEIQRYRIPVTLFIYPSAISNASYAMTWDQLAQLASLGLVDIQSHTYWHPNFNHERAKLAPNAYRAFVSTQFARSKQVLEGKLRGKVDLLAWPFGIHDPELEHWASEAGYKAAFTLQRLPASHASSLLALPRYLVTDADNGARFAALIENATSPGDAP